jgi:GNAT superfamily N-acetyltransferase
VNRRIVISPARSPADVQAVSQLFEQYASSLPIDLGYQDFSCELASLPGKYAPPTGELLIARDEQDAAVGCVGIRPLPEAGWSEMKRLFILPEKRGTGLGKALAQAAIERAKSLGYAEMRLDTLPTMRSAITLYGRLGFRPCAPYYAPTPAGTLFLAKSL